MIHYMSTEWGKKSKKNTCYFLFQTEKNKTFFRERKATNHCIRFDALYFSFFFSHRSENNDNCFTSSKFDDTVVIVRYRIIWNSFHFCSKWTTDKINKWSTNISSKVIEMSIYIWYRKLWHYSLHLNWRRFFWFHFLCFLG
jgi:hypothetical protein